jgi:hypothetical protein
MRGGPPTPAPSETKSRGCIRLRATVKGPGQECGRTTALQVRNPRSDKRRLRRPELALGCRSA